MNMHISQHEQFRRKFSYITLLKLSVRLQNCLGLIHTIKSRIKINGVIEMEEFVSNQQNDV